MAKCPKLAALAVVHRNDDVLLVRRKHEPDANLWGFPGGHVAFGEPVGEAACRELYEETSLRATPRRVLTNLEMIIPDDEGRPVFHFYLAAVECAFVSGEPRGQDDVFEAAWISCQDVFKERIPLSDHVKSILKMAMEDQT